MIQLILQIVTTKATFTLITVQQLSNAKSFNIQQRILYFLWTCQGPSTITFEQGKHYVQCIIGFYMNYTDWVGVADSQEDTGAWCGTINNSA